jgi:hypothetical protein
MVSITIADSTNVFYSSGGDPVPGIFSYVLAVSMPAMVSRTPALASHDTSVSKNWCKFFFAGILLQNEIHAVFSLNRLVHYRGRKLKA